MSTVIQVENLTKHYQLGVIGYGTLRQDLQSLWAKIRKKEDPNEKVNVITDNQNKKNKVANFLALNDISFKVKDGEVLGIIGKNGAGKSTLLKVLSRITAPTKGCVKIKGKIGSLLEVGTGFHPELTGKENIYLSGAIFGMKKKEIDKKLDEIIDFSGVEKFMDTPVKRYSSGMYVRLGFAVAAHLDPDILIVDEVLAVGDVEFQKKCINKMGDVSSKQGRTILFVSHNMEAIRQLCGKSMLLEKGMIKTIGDSNEVVNEYIISNQLNKVTVKDRKDRKGDGLAKCNDIFIKDKKGKYIDRFKLGEPIKFEVCVDFDKSAIGKNVEINLIFSDILDVRFFSLQNKIVKSNFKIKHKNGRFYCKLKEGVPLVPGEYNITVSILISGVLSDKVINARKFEVLSNKYFGISILPPKTMGPVLIKQEWDYKK